MTIECPACGGRDLTVAVEIMSIPVHVGVLWPSAGKARSCPRGDVRLAFCRTCGFLHNAAFDESLVDYSLSYDNALHFSGVFQEYELDLAHRLIDRYDLRKKLIVEIGCGPAHFLGLLCQLGDNRGLGFDPSHDPDHLDELAMGRVEVRRQYFDESAAAVRPDLVCARHLLEHIADPRALLEALQGALREDTAVYFEVPNALLAIEQLSIWDLMYEHCGYFTVGSLRRLFMTTGFDVIEVNEAYGDQFVGIEARASTPQTIEMPRHESDRLSSLIAAFSKHFEDTRLAWNDRLRQLGEAGRRVVVWGAGGKGVSFMNFLAEAHQVDALVDINPRKQGMYLAGTGHEIISPHELTERQPEVVVVMNPLYQLEIQESLRSLGLERATVTSAI